MRVQNHVGYIYQYENKQRHSRHSESEASSRSTRTFSKLLAQITFGSARAQLQLTREASLTFGLMTKAVDALEVVIKHMGIAACPECMTADQRQCTHAMVHVSTGTCFYCESVHDMITEHGYDCPATALTRLSQTCKTTAEARNPAQVQTHIQTRQIRKDQFNISEDALEAWMENSRFDFESDYFDNIPDHDPLE